MATSEIKVDQENEVTVTDIATLVMSTQNKQFNALSETLTNTLNNMGLTLQNTVNTLSACFAETVEKMSEDPKRNRHSEVQPPLPESKDKGNKLSEPGTSKTRQQDLDEDTVSITAPSDDELDQDIHKIASLGVEEEEEPEDELLTELSAEFNSDSKVDRDVNKHLAKAANDIWQQKLSKDKLFARLDKHEKPKNCDQIKAIKVNAEIFNIIPAGTRSNDLKNQKIQNMLLKATYPILKLLDYVIENKEVDKQKIKELALDSFSMLSQTNQEVLQTRRDNISKSLSKEYKQLKNDIPKNSSFLLGDDIVQRLKLLQASSKACQGMSAPRRDFGSSSTRPKPYERHWVQKQQNFSNSKNFSGPSKKYPFQDKAKRFNTNNKKN